MVKLINFADVHMALRQFYANAKPGPYTLDTMRALMQHLGNPQDTLRVVHVAGTSGKTSTAYFIAALLKESGAKVGLTVSPHVDEVNERVQVGLVPLDEATFCAEFGEFLELVEGSKLKPSYFEVMVAFAYWEFARKGVDYAVVEVGLGGLLDGTNVVSREDKVCVITDIGFDHVEVLGNTLGEIAAQKAGIIQQRNQVFMYRQGEEVMVSVEAAAAEKEATLNLVSIAGGEEYVELAGFQQRNFGLARAVVSFVLERDKPGAQLSDSQLQAASRVYIPGRMEVVQLGEKTLVMDGAHNAQKLHTFLESLQQRFPSEPFTALVGFVESEPGRLEHALDEVLPQTQHLIATSFYGEKDYAKHSVNPEVIAQYCQSKGYEQCEVQAEPRDAFAVLLARPEKLLVVTGSFYLLEHIRPLIVGATT